MNKLGIILLLASSLLSGQNKEEFRDFEYKFFSDSTFQISRVTFPLLKIVLNMQNLKDDSALVSQDRWKFNDFGFWQNSYNIQRYDNYAGQLRNTNERVIAFQGSENGINVSLYFARIKGKWFLIKWIDAST